MREQETGLRACEVLGGGLARQTARNPRPHICLGLCRNGQKLGHLARQTARSRGVSLSSSRPPRRSPMTKSGHSFGVRATAASYSSAEMPLTSVVTCARRRPPLARRADGVASPGVACAGRRCRGGQAGAGTDLDALAFGVVGLRGHGPRKGGAWIKDTEVAAGGAERGARLG